MRRPAAAALGSDAGKERRVPERCRVRGSPQGLSPCLGGSGWQPRAAARAVLPGSRSGGDPRGVFLSGLSANPATPPLERKTYAATFDTVRRQCRPRPSHGGAEQCFLSARCPDGPALRCSRSGGAPRTSARLSPQQRPRGAPRRFFTAQPRAASQRSAAAVPPRCSPPLPPFGPEQTSPQLFLKIFGNFLLCARCKNVKRFGEFFLPGFTLFSLRAIKRCGNR